jgi:phosphoribosylformylglycinamidine cyclo-ligase
VKAAVHITGDAYLKFNNLTRFSSGIGFEFTNFKPHPIFRILQETAHELGLTVSDEEMYRTFNMGWGFAIIVDKKEADTALSVLQKMGAEAENIGTVKGKPGIGIRYRSKRIALT